MAKILVVDDSSIIRRNLSSILTEAGHTVVGEAANGEAAYKEYEKLEPNLVTMDITMPILDGIAAVKKIIKYYPDANIIMISALDQKQMVLSAIQNGAKHYIIKPFAAEKVITVVNDVLSVAEASEKAAVTLTSKLDDTISEIHSSIEDLDKSIDVLSDDIPSENSKTGEPKTEDTALPFSIESRVNQLNINLSRNIKSENFQSLNMITQGFLFMKSLTVVLNLGDNKQFDEDVLKKLIDLARSIKGHGANIKITAKNNEVLEFVKSKNEFFASVIE